MKACGLIVEYNPFHNGHFYHIQEAKKASKADCMIAVMSGSFLQRGEPAIVDKYTRAKTALESGADIVVELPYLFAVQNSDIFSYGAVATLNEIGASSVCFGSESGDIKSFIESYHILKKNTSIYQAKLTEYLDQGFSFPEASKHAYQHIGLTTADMDLSKPNNILGFSYVKAIYDHQFQLEPLTIKRVNNDFHDQTIQSSIASATSIRKKLLATNQLTADIKETLPTATINQLQQYEDIADEWHHWELYFPFLHYKVMVMSAKELATILGVDEGIEYRIKQTAKEATSLYNWIQSIKTKRYTWTRIQRMFVHLLTNTRKNEMQLMKADNPIPYIRLLGFTKQGQTYLQKKKKEISVNMVSNFKRNQHPLLNIEEKAAHAYYSVLPPEVSKRLFKQELQPPIQVN